jgi:very-short-patch-repair endonuclease
MATPVEVLVAHGGLLSGTTLRAATSPKRVRGALARGEILRVGHNRYGLPGQPHAIRVAAALGGVLSHTSAAARHGWEVPLPLERPHVAVPRGRKVRSQVDARLHRLRVISSTDGIATDPEQTVLDCARDLPFPVALSVADSALRHGVDPQRLSDAAASLRGASAARVRRIVAQADPGAANPFESSLRALALEAGLAVETQHPIPVRDHVVHPDLVDLGRRLVLEADSFSHHADPSAFAQDCYRYNDLVVRGWRVLRFPWVSVVPEPWLARRTLRELVG